MATTYSSLHSNIRNALKDFGSADADEVTQYQYQTTDINAALDNVLLKLSGYSGDGTSITPTVSDDNVKGFLIYATAFELAADPERIVRWREGDTTIERENKEFIIRLLEEAQDFYYRKYGIPYAQRGALEDSYDHDTFTDYLESIISQ